MGEAGRQLPDGGQPLADPGAFLQGLDLGQVLEQQQLAGFLATGAPEGSQMPTQDLGRATCQRKRHLEAVLSRKGLRQGEHLVDRATQGHGLTQNGRRSWIRGGDPPGRIQRDEAGGHGLHDSEVQGRQLVHRGFAGAEIRAQAIEVAAYEHHHQGRGEDLQGGDAEQEGQTGPFRIRGLARQPERRKQPEGETQHQEDVGDG